MFSAQCSVPGQIYLSTGAGWGRTSAAAPGEPAGWTGTHTSCTPAFKSPCDGHCDVRKHSRGSCLFHTHATTPGGSLHFEVNPNHAKRQHSSVTDLKVTLGSECESLSSV